ncbi:MAG: hypothetical protein ACI9UA_003039 [Pseudoalteromonas tetraodonis]|jgi:hypothetical protein
MIAEAPPQAFAFVIGFVAITNWIVGDRSILGRRLLLRDETSFRLFRHVGLGLFVAAMSLSTIPEWHPLIWLFAYAGASLMLIGTAKKYENKKSTEQDASGARRQ